ncbi:MAG: J domain-containing protein, partial [Thermoprotei archaeon]
ETSGSESYAEKLAHEILAATNPFEVLGLPVSENLTDEDVLEAYRKRSSLFHPGTYHDPNSEEIMRKLTEARNELQTPSLRKQALDRIRATHIGDTTKGGSEMKPPPRRPKQPQGGVKKVHERLTIYCMRCQAQGKLVAIKHSGKSYIFKSGRSYDVYERPTPGCGGQALANYVYGELIGVGQKP